jgi:FMN phosphatase YigB (HAD superfamily)
LPQTDSGLHFNLFISEDIGFHKPRREFFDAVLHDMGISDPGRAVVVGDTPGSDILGAKNAGLDAVWYNPKGRPARPDLSPVLIAANFDQIENFILGRGV